MTQKAGAGIIKNSIPGTEYYKNIDSYRFLLICYAINMDANVIFKVHCKNAKASGNLSGAVYKVDRAAGKVDGANYKVGGPSVKKVLASEKLQTASAKLSDPPEKLSAPIAKLT